MGTVARRVELAFSRLFLVSRGLAVVVAVLSLVSELPRMSSRGLAVGCVVVSVTQNAWLAARILRRGRLDGPWVLVADAVVQAGLVAVSLLPADGGDSYRIRGWFQPMMLHSVAAAALSQSLWLVGGVVVLSAGVLTAAAIEPDTTPAWLVQNPGAMVGLAVLAWVFVRYLRQIALAADRAHAGELAATAALERARARDLVHDPAGTLERLASAAAALTRSARSAGTPELAGLCRTVEFEVARARRDSRGFRAFLQGRAMTVTDLEAVVVEASADFPDLAVSVVAGNLEQPLDEPVAEVVAGAVRTLLANALTYAGPETAVSIFADVTAGVWTVRVTDDGPGFDLDATSLGHGLREVVRGAVERLGGAVVIDTSVGQGVSVELQGPARVPANGNLGQEPDAAGLAVPEHGLP